MKKPKHTSLINNAIKSFDKNNTIMIIEKERIILNDDTYLIPDVLILKKDLKIAIECGYLSKKDKIHLLKEHCDKVIYYPYIECFGSNNTYCKNPTNGNTKTLNVRFPIKIKNLVKKVYKMFGYMVALH